MVIVGGGGALAAGGLACWVVDCAFATQLVRHNTMMAAHSRIGFGLRNPLTSMWSEIYGVKQGMIEQDDVAVFFVFPGWHVCENSRRALKAHSRRTKTCSSKLGRMYQFVFAL
jgi:hypothetical protein